MLHYMNLQDKPFKMIDKGIKKIEMRLYDEKRRKISIGDVIEFSNGNNVIRAKVINLHRFNNFKELYANFSKDLLGYMEDETADSVDMEKYYSVTEIENYGVIGIEIEKIN